MQKYKIIEVADEPRQLEAQVEEYLKKGWALAGGISIAMFPIPTSNLPRQLVAIRYAQALVKD